RAVEPRFSRVNLLDGLEEDLPRHLLLDDAHGAEPERVLVDLGVAKARQDQDARLGSGAAQVRDEIESRLGTEIEIQQDEVGPPGRSDRHGPRAIRGLPHDPETVLALDQHLQARSDDGVIVHQEYPNGCRFVGRRIHRFPPEPTAESYSGTSMLTTVAPFSRRRT